MNFAYLCCMSSNSVTMPSKLLPISGDGYTSDWTVRRCFQKFRSVDQSHEDEKGRGRVCSLDNKQLQAIVQQNLQQSAKEMFEVPFKYPVNEAVAVLLQC